MEINIQEINNLINDPASVPLPIKIGAVVLIFGITVFLGFKLVIVDQMASLETIKATETEKREAYEKKQARANQLPAFKSQLAEMQVSFGTLKDQLPSDTEIPGLILDISEKGLTNGLEIDLFKPKPEISKEFFAEKPIKFKAKGTYEQLSSFVNDLSALPRIVTINDIHLKPLTAKNDGSEKSQKDKKDSRISFEATIKTYRYLNEDESEDDEDEDEGEAPLEELKG